MNNKSTKKQPSAQALSDDDLENIAGGVFPKEGWEVGDPEAEKEKIIKAYAKELQDLGYTVETNSDGKISVKDSNGNHLANWQAFLALLRY